MHQLLCGAAVAAALSPRNVSPFSQTIWQVGIEREREREPKQTQGWMQQQQHTLGDLCVYIYLDISIVAVVVGGIEKGGFKVRALFFVPQISTEK